ncbi:MAG TPA: PAS domain-containing sensor histidine kinase [Gemmatimonadaceae bacterium]|nr:PAS domain-containing sensor histidine kinase [Gemmatimonadaceae bacterium]
MTAPKKRVPDQSEHGTGSSEERVQKAGTRRDDAVFVGGGGAKDNVLEGPALYGLLVESVVDYAIFALDTGGHVLSWNAGAVRMKGYTPDEIIGKHFSIFYPDEDVARGKTTWELEVAARDGRFEDEGWRVRKDGTRFWANVVITALRTPDGELVGFAKITRDLSERRDAEEELRLSEERFRLLVQTVKDYAIFMLDPTGHVATWNEGARRIKGYTADEIIGRHFSVFYPPEDVSKTTWELDVAAREGRFEDEGWRLRKDGTRFWANVIITPLLDKTGTLVGFAKVTRDLTERKASEDRAVRDASRLAAAEAASRTKSEFLATMSHELRTPLNAIGGYADLLDMGVAGAVTEEQRSYLARIRNSQQHLLAIINDLLNYSRSEAGQVAYDLDRVSLHDVVEHATPMMIPQANAKGITIAHGPCKPAVEAWADQQKVEQIVLNLLSNAVKFTPEGGRVTVACAFAQNQGTITVSDTGPGIPPDKFEAIFEPFVQLGRSLTSQQQGTGLGLAISRDLARAMGGDLLVDGAPDGGAKFTLTLPRVESMAEQGT